MASLRDDLACFDGKHTDLLERIAVSLSVETKAPPRLIAAAEQAEHDRIAVAATWVLLRLCEGGRAALLGASEIERLCVLLTRTHHWEVRLHILRTLALCEPVATSTQALRAMVAAAALKVANDAKPFVRAWAINLLALLGDSLPGARKQEIGRLIGAAEATESASVKARVRQLRKAGTLAWMDTLAL